MFIYEYRSWLYKQIRKSQSACSLLKKCYFVLCMVLRGFGRPRIIEYSAFNKSNTFLCIVQIHAVFETVLLYHILYLGLLIPLHTQNSLYYLGYVLIC